MLLTQAHHVIETIARLIATYPKNHANSCITPTTAPNIPPSAINAFLKLQWRQLLHLLADRILHIQCLSSVCMHYAYDQSVMDGNLSITFLRNVFLHALR